MLPRPEYSGPWNSEQEKHSEEDRSKDRAEPPIITGGKIAAVGIDRTRRIREGRNDSHDPKLDAQQNGELIKPTTTVAQTVVAQGQRFPRPL